MPRRNNKKISVTALKLENRIKSYLSIVYDKNPKAFIDIDDIVNYLQQQNAEYRRNSTQFRTQVKQICIEKELRVHTNDNNGPPLKKARLSDSDSELMDDVPLMIVEDTNNMNNSMRVMYDKKKIKSGTNVINISDNDNIKVSSTGRLRRSRSKSKNNNKQQSQQQQQQSTETKKWRPESYVPTVTYEDCGGIENILQEVRELIEYPLIHPEIYKHLGVQPPRGVLLHGPPGCGKTLLAHAIAGELGVHFLKISAPEIVSGMSGESEAKMRSLFQEAQDSAPSIIFIDEIDAIASKRSSSQRGMERRIVAQMLTCMDDLSSVAQNDDGKTVIVLGATNIPDALDPALRRAGRFDRELSVGIPDDDARARILSVLCRKMRLPPDFDFTAITKRTAGYVGADLAALVKEAAVVAVNRCFSVVLMTPVMKHITPSLINQPPPMSLEQLNDNNDNEAKMNNDDNDDESTQEITEKQKKLRLDERTKVSDRLKARKEPLTPEELAPLFMTMPDFEIALTKVQPSSKREGFATIPDSGWDDIGALEHIREELNMAILQPIANPKQFEMLGLSVPAGVLLYGPPGCGKTLIAKAIAKESGASFLSIKGPELLNQYVGESERAVRQVFQRARSSPPCVIFFDELDALCPKRGRGSEGSAVSERVVNQLLTEMDGLDDRRRVFVIAATNRPDIIDPAMLRPGRLDKLLYVALPNPKDRLAILEKHVRRMPLCNNVDLSSIAQSHKANGFSGADLASLTREAALCALKEAQKRNISLGNDPLSTIVDVRVTNEHFNYAFTKVSPSVSEAAQRLYDRRAKTLRRARASQIDEPTVPTTTTTNIDDSKTI